MTTDDQLATLAAWMDADEGDRFEFKEAKNRYDFEELVKYCCALANERGGRVILGVTDTKPRRVVGSRAFSELPRTEQGINDRLRVIKVDAAEMDHPDGRVVVFDVPSRPLGYPLQHKGAFWMRSGDQLAPMTPDVLGRIYAEAVPDVSALVCPGAKLVDLDPLAIEDFRQRWMRRTGNRSLGNVGVLQLLEDAELLVDGGVTTAALILLGTAAALGRHVAQAEIVYEYRASEANLPAQQRVELRQGFFATYEKLWELVNLRNDRQAYREGLFVLDVPTFDEASVREALLNAVAHRDYRLSGSVFIRQYPHHMEVVSPGGFPPGVDATNILERQIPRNRRIAEAFARCGLVERSGQGVNRMYEEAIRRSHPLPDFSGSDAYQVALVLRGEIQNPAFIAFLEKLGAERLARFTTMDLLVLDAIQRDAPIPGRADARLTHLVDAGVIERIGRGRGVHYTLSRALYAHLGQRGTYTRKRGLDHGTNKELLLQHFRRAGAVGSSIGELCQVLPQLSRKQVGALLQELRREGRTTLSGERRWARWFAAPDASVPQVGGVG